MAFQDAPHELFSGGFVANDTNFSSWNAISVNYCDGSVFMGDNDVQQANGSVRYHHGRQNLAAALDVAVAHFPKPKRVLLVGWSAGGYGSLTAALATRLRYPEADFYVLNDSGLGLFNLAETTDMQQRLDEWKYGDIIPPSCAQCDGGRGQLAGLFSWLLEHDENVRIGAASFYQDQTISFFLRMQPSEYEPFLRTTMTTVHDAHPDRFRRFMLPGTSHVLGADWSRQTASGIHFDAWTVAMTNHDDTTWQDIEADCAYTCCHPDQASCDAAAGCMSVFGQDARSHPEAWAGCIPRARCTERITCAVPPSGPPCIQFPSSCLPSGWEAESCDSANPTYIGTEPVFCELPP